MLYIGTDAVLYNNEQRRWRVRREKNKYVIFDRRLNVIIMTHTRIDI